MGSTGTADHSSSTQAFTWERRELFVSLGIAVLAIALLLLSGWRLRIPWEYSQILSEHALRTAPWESLYYLHAQPPLLNLGLAIALQVEGALGVPASLLLFLVQCLVALATVLGFVRLAGALIRNPVLRRIGLAAFLLHPVFYSAVFLWFYTLHELCLLVWIAVSTLRIVREPALGRFVLLAGLLLLLVWTRSLFHPIFCLSYFGLVWFFARRRVYLRQLLPLALVLAGAVLAWPVKNKIVFDYFGYSSFQGYNASRGLHVKHPPILYMFQDGSSKKSIEARNAARGLVPESFRGVEVLAEPEKAEGVPNWNHFVMLAYNRTMMQQVEKRLRSHPGEFVDRAIRNYREGYALYAGRNPYRGSFEGRAASGWVATWMRVHEVLFHGLPSENPTKGFPGLYYLLFPLLYVLVLVRALRSREDRGFYLATLFTVSWVLLLVLCVDGQEGNRMRFGTEGLFLLLSLASFQRLSSQQEQETRELRTAAPPPA